MSEDCIKVAVTFSKSKEKIILFVTEDEGYFEIEIKDGYKYKEDALDFIPSLLLCEFSVDRSMAIASWVFLKLTYIKKDILSRQKKEDSFNMLYHLTQAYQMVSDYTAVIYGLNSRCEVKELNKQIITNGLDPSLYTKLVK